MLHPSPVGGFGELFPSLAKGHQDNPGLSDEQDAEAQALVNAALGGYYTRVEVASLLAGKEPSIAEGRLARAKSKISSAISRPVPPPSSWQMQSQRESPSLQREALRRAKSKVSPATSRPGRCKQTWLAVSRANRKPLGTGPFRRRRWRA